MCVWEREREREMMDGWCFRARCCTVRLSWAGDNLGKWRDIYILKVRERERERLTERERERLRSKIDEKVPTCYKQTIHWCIFFYSIVLCWYLTVRWLLCLFIDQEFNATETTSMAISGRSCCWHISSLGTIDVTCGNVVLLLFFAYNNARGSW